MTLNVKYFGSLAEITERKEEDLLFLGSSVSDLLDLLFLKYPHLKEKDFQVAHHNQIVSKDARITEDEIALLPPFSGG